MVLKLKPRQSSVLNDSNKNMIFTSILSKWSDISRIIGEKLHDSEPERIDSGTETLVESEVRCKVVRGGFAKIKMKSEKQDLTKSKSIQDLPPRIPSTDITQLAVVHGRFLQVNSSLNLHSLVTSPANENSVNWIFCYRKRHSDEKEPEKVTENLAVSSGDSFSSKVWCEFVEN